jgi:hypothetical protein
MRGGTFLLGLLLVVAPSCADTQQENTKACNAEAVKQELTGNKHEAFMKQCLAAKSEAAAASTGEKKKPTPQQLKMKQCNADAKAQELKGDVRKTFMSACLKAG